MRSLSICCLLLSSGVVAQPAEPDPLAVTRPNAVYQTVLTKTPTHRLVTSYHNQFYRSGGRGASEQAGNVLSAEQRTALASYAAAGIDGPFVPQFIDRFGAAAVDEWFAKGMQFPYFPHTGAYSKPARDAGAVFVFSDAYGSGERGRVACWDPHYMDLANAAVEEWLKQNGKKPWISCILGYDEPLNYAGTVRSPKAVDIVNRAIQQQYHIKLRLTAQDPNVAQTWTMTDPAILNQDPNDVALLRVAVWRWLNDQLREAARREYKIVKTYAPQLEYIAFNRNAISIMDFISKYVPNSIDRVDESKLFDFTDGYSADPYPTYNLKAQGQPRALYHVGFVSKMMTDLGAGKPSKIIMQAFEFHDRMPTPANLREWASQAAKAGVTHLEWFGDPRTEDPELFREMLRLSKLWKHLPALDIPKTSDIAVIFSDDSRNATNDDLLSAHYVLHYLLGEKLGAWYTMVGENQVRQNRQSLAGYKLILAPEISYVSKAFAEKLTAAVEKGATLVVFDPDALHFDIETGSLAAQRMQLLGAPLGRKREASHFVATADGRRRFADTDLMLIEPGKSGEIARTLAVPKDARVLFNYEDGTPGVYSRKLGQGEVIVFSALPMADTGPTFTIGTSGLLTQKIGWDTFLAGLCKEKNIQTGLPIWQFLFPASGE